MSDWMMGVVREACSRKDASLIICACEPPFYGMILIHLGTWNADEIGSQKQTDQVLRDRVFSTIKKLADVVGRLVCVTKTHLDRRM